MGAVKQARMKQGLSAKQETSYNRFFVNAFTEKDIEDIVEEGGAQSKENFIKSAKDNIKEKGYWQALMNKGDKERTFKGRDGKVRRSKFQARYDTLGEAIYKEYFKGLQDERVTLREYERKGKEKSFYRVRKVVAKGEKIRYSGKTYKGGQFLPGSFKLKKK